MHARSVRHLILLFAFFAPAPLVSAQEPRGLLAPLPAGAFRGGVPEQTATTEPIDISIGDAIHRALARNLGAVQALETLDRASAHRVNALSEFWPELHATASASRRTTSLEAFGLPLGPAFPPVVGPYNVYELRGYATQSIFDLSARRDLDARTQDVAAAQHDYRDARDRVVLVTASLYLQTLAASARLDSARAQLETAEALHRQAQNLRESGIVAGLDVVRAEVRLMSDRQRATAADNDLQKLQLQLARVIGLPVGQPFRLSNQLPEVPVPQIPFEEALARAYQERPDYLAAQARVRSAQATRAAAQAERLPSARVNADYGAIGLTPGAALPTFNVTGLVDVPLFRGSTNARLAEADAELRGRTAEADDLRAEIYYDVKTAFLDLKATGEELEAATRGRDLAAQQLAQSRDRFTAGVASGIEVVEAQEAVARASEQYIAALYGYNIAKAMLARSLGSAEDAIERYLGGSAR